jgi:hypothetical protein
MRGAHTARNATRLVIPPAVSDDDARKTCPDGWKLPLPYIRIVAQPR